MAASPPSDNGAAGSEEKGQTSSTTENAAEIVEGTGVPDSIQKEAAAAVPNPVAASPVSDKGAAGSENKVPTLLAGRRSLCAIVLAAVAFPILLMVSFDGHPMSQVWILSVSSCLYIFIFLVCIWRGQWFFSYCVRLSYAPLLAFSSATAIGPATATFVLFFSTVWAAANLGYSLAVHRLLKGTEPAIHALPSPSFHTKDSVKELSFNIYVRAPFAVLVWALLMAMIINVATVTDELDILFILSYFGWIHVAVWVFFVTQLPAHGVLFREQMLRLLPFLVQWMIISPAISFASQILSVLCHFLLMMALVAFLWYNLAIYMHFLETATTSTTNHGDEGTQFGGIQLDNIEKVKSDRTLEDAKGAAATLLSS